VPAYAALFACLDLFPVSFYGRDARERLSSLGHSLRESVPALLNVLTVTIFMITLSIVGGLYRGATQWVQRFVGSNPMARTILVSTLTGRTRQFIDEEVLEQARALAPGGKSTVEGAYGYTDTLWYFHKASGGVDRQAGIGRTVDLGDPILTRIKPIGRWSDAHPPFFRRGRTRAEDGLQQAIASVSLVRSLGYSRDDLKTLEKVTVDYGDEGLDVELVAVADPLPPGAGDFIVTDGFMRQKNENRLNPDPEFDRVYFGPVPAGRTAAELIEKLKPLTDSRINQVTVEIVRLGDGLWLLLHRQPWKKSRWENFIGAAVRSLEDLGRGMKAEFTDPLPPKVAPSPPSKAFFTNISIYVRKLEDVVATSDAVENELNLAVIGDAKQLALLFLQVNSMADGILLAVIVVVGTLTSLSIGLSITQSIQRKSQEIAILKAYGSGNTLVVSIYLIEAAIVWALAAAVALLLVDRVSVVVNRELARIITTQGILGGSGSGPTPQFLDISPVVLGSVAGCSLALCFGVTLFASLAAARLEPAQALRAGQK
jgi:hypothetical protein